MFQEKTHICLNYFLIFQQIRIWNIFKPISKRLIFQKKEFQKTSKMWKWPCIFSALVVFDLFPLFRFNSYLSGMKHNERNKGTKHELQSIKNLLSRQIVDSGVRNHSFERTWSTRCFGISWRAYLTRLQLKSSKRGALKQTSAHQRASLRLDQRYTQPTFAIEYCPHQRRNTVEHQGCWHKQTTGDPHLPLICVLFFGSSRWACPFFPPRWTWLNRTLRFLNSFTLAAAKL